MNELIIERIKNLSDANQGAYDKFHFELCEQIIEEYRKRDVAELTYGQAQKWVNMTMKYLSMISHSSVKKCYEYCHIPIDNYILQATSKTLSTTWSRLEDYDEYLSFQNVPWSSLP